MKQSKEISLYGTRVGAVKRIYVIPSTGADPDSRESVEAVVDRGIKGDRYYRDEGIYNEQDELDPSDVTLIEAEALDATAEDYGIDLAPGAHRRNITTRGVALNHLVGNRFRVGEAVFEGIDLCEPCRYMESHANQSDAATALKHRGGLDAQIVRSGTITINDEIVW